MSEKKLPLQERRRPKTFNEVWGNDDEVTKLDGLIRRRDALPNAILLTGPRGCGKTTLARVIQNELEIDENDFIELDTAADRGIDAIRNIRQQAQFKPLVSPLRIYFFDECHGLTPQAQEAMLKMLENPPAHVMLILATTEPQVLKDTFRSRCTSVKVELLSDRDMKDMITYVLKKEQVEGFPAEAISAIVESAAGCPREALVLLDSLLVLEDNEAIIRTAKKKEVLNEKSPEFLPKLMWAGEPWPKIAAVLQGLSENEVEGMRHATLSYMSTILLNPKTTNEKRIRAGNIMARFEEPFFYAQKPRLVLACWDVCNSMN